MLFPCVLSTSEFIDRVTLTLLDVAITAVTVSLFGYSVMLRSACCYISNFLGLLSEMLVHLNVSLINGIYFRLSSDKYDHSYLLLLL